MERYKSKCQNCGGEPITYENEWCDGNPNCTYCRTPLTEKRFFPFCPKKKKPVAPKKAEKPTEKTRRKYTKCNSKVVVYKDYIQSKKWKKKRWQALNHYGCKCAICGSKKQLQVHHKHYRTLGCEEMKDLQVLCAGCHENHHEHEGKCADPMTRAFLNRSKTF